MAYERVNWENLPSTKTPVNADNLNKMVEKSDLLNLIYPVGSIYMSINSTNPSNLFGGTWEQIKDRFLLACGDTYKNGATGGEATHTLTIDEMPSHSHKLLSNTTQGSSDTISILSTFQGSDENAAFRHSGYVGGSKAHNNMPPYLAVYMWKRTK